MSGLDLEIYNFIRRYAVENGFLPTITEIAEAFCFVISTANYRLIKLEKNGYIVRHENGIRYSVKGLRYIAE